MTKLFRLFTLSRKENNEMGDKSELLELVKNLVLEIFKFLKSIFAGDDEEEG